MDPELRVVLTRLIASSPLTVGPGLLATVLLMARAGPLLDLSSQAFLGHPGTDYEGSRRSI